MEHSLDLWSTRKDQLYECSATRWPVSEVTGMSHETRSASNSADASLSTAMCSGNRPSCARRGACTA
eukprot:scaffold876_cov68-Phaeocystis_antarctica.AAC.12